MRRTFTYIFFISLLFHFTTSDIYSQTDEGSFVVNGRTNLQLEFGENAPFTLGLMGGYFAADNLALGIDFNIDRRNLFTRYGVKPFARYYLFKVLFFGAGLRYDAVVTDNDSDSEFSLDLEVGGLIMLTDQVGLEPTLRVPVSRESNVALLIGFSFFF